MFYFCWNYQPEKDSGKTTYPCNSRWAGTKIYGCRLNEILRNNNSKHSFLDWLRTTALEAASCLSILKSLLQSLDTWNTCSLQVSMRNKIFFHFVESTAFVILSSFLSVIPDCHQCKYYYYLLKRIHDFWLANTQLWNRHMNLIADQI